MRCRILFPALLPLLPGLVWSQTPTVRDTYTKQETNITMRDGKKLFTSIYLPKDTSQKWPMIMTRTPYSVRPYGPDAYRDSLGPDGRYAQEKYIFVFQDVRGRYMSEGEFQWMTPYIPAKTGSMVDESTDTYDTIDWLVKNLPNNNGRVGMVGTSFPGHYVAQALIDPHPALKCASPQAPMADNWLGDDMHHNGAFFLPHAMNFIAGFDRPHPGPQETYTGERFRHGTPDGYDFFLKMGPLANAAKKYGLDKSLIWLQWMKHGDYNEYWQKQNVPQHLKKVGRVAVMTVGGWWDAEDLYGPLAIYKAIEKNNPRAINTLVMGPWYHGSWNRGPGDALHDIKWETKTGDDFTKMQLAFFDHYLKGQNLFTRSGAGAPPWPINAFPGDYQWRPIPEAWMFDVGADKWREFNEWPPKAVEPHNLWLGRGGYLSLVDADTPFPQPRNLQRPVYDEYVSDPWRPVPNSATITTGMARSYMIEDQRFVWGRPDVLSYESPVLAQDVTVVGPVSADLRVSTTGSDADFIVKLIDVFPADYGIASPRGADVRMGGYQMLIRGEPMRAKYRNSWSKPEPMPVGKFGFGMQDNYATIEPVKFVLPDVCHTFKKGHRIMVQVHSTWFPLIDRNPQKFTNIYAANESDFQKAVHRVYVGEGRGSHVSVQVLK